MSRADFEEYWVRRNKAVKDLVQVMRLHKALGDVDGLFKKMLSEIVPLSKWLLEKDPRAHRIVHHVNEILITEWRFKNMGKEQDPGLAGIPQDIKAMQLVLDKGEQFSLRLYDLMEELGI